MSYNKDIIANRDDLARGIQVKKDILIRYLLLVDAVVSRYFNIICPICNSDHSIKKTVYIPSKFNKNHTNKDYKIAVSYCDYTERYVIFYKRRYFGYMISILNITDISKFMKYIHIRNNVTSTTKIRPKRYQNNKIAIDKTSYSISKQYAKDINRNIHQCYLKYKPQIKEYFKLLIISKLHNNPLLKVFYNPRCNNISPKALEHYQNSVISPKALEHYQNSVISPKKLEPILDTDELATTTNISVPTNEDLDEFLNSYGIH